MRLDKLQLDLRPRPNSQALDLGFDLLRSHFGHAYLAWLALWIPVILLCGILSELYPGNVLWFLLAAWWVKPLLERAPLYVLSRKVFGDDVTWTEALRAWPKQLAGGWFRMMTWWRPFAAGRGLYQAIWQLEGARGKAASDRRKVIRRDDAGRSAVVFGITLFTFEIVLFLGLALFLHTFLSVDESLQMGTFFESITQPENSLVAIRNFICYALAVGVTGPIYTACCFTLYLNRRATLEAWDIEIMLRQIEPPEKRVSSEKKRRRSGALLSLLAPLVLGATMFWGEPAQAFADTSPASANLDKCAPPPGKKQTTTQRTPDAAPEQAKLRREVDELAASEDFRGYRCEERWKFKESKDKKKEPPKAKDMDSSWLSWLINSLHIAELLKIFLIAAAIGAVVWLLYRYRDNFSVLFSGEEAAPATEVGGLDIRPESLPDDVTDEVRKLWAAGERRAALGLLYRATLSRLVSTDGLRLTRGATEGDCLRLANQARLAGKLSAERMQITATVTDLWLNGAYASRWPSTEAVTDSCAAWQSEFGPARLSQTGRK